MKNQLINQGKALLLSAALIGASATTLSVTAAEASYDNGVEQQQVQKKGQHKKNKHFRKMAKFLKLSDEQKVQIKAIHQESKTAMEANREAMKAFKAEKKAIATDETLDEQAFLDLHAQYSTNFAQMQLNQLKTKFAIRAVLTEEQREKWQKHQQRKGKKGKKGQKGKKGPKNPRS